VTIFFPGQGDQVLPGYRGEEFAFVGDTSWREFLELFCPDAPEILVFDGATELTDGQATPIDFGAVRAGASPLSRTFVIRNQGTTDLYLGELSLPAQFTSDGFALDSIEPGKFLPFTVSLSTDSLGAWTGDVGIRNDDFDEYLFSFPVSGTVFSSGEITVQHNGNGVVNGQTVPIDFGLVDHNDPVTEQVFTVRNDGANELTIGTVSVPVGFTVTQPAQGLLAPGEETTFAVAMDSSVMGEHTGPVAFINSDADESSFSFAISGTVSGADLVVTDFDYVPGAYATGKDSFNVSTYLTNTGLVDVPATQAVQLEVRLSRDTTWGNADDVVVYAGADLLPDLAVGEDSPTYGKIVRTSFGGAEPGDYYVAVKVNPDGSVDEMNLDNNVAWSATPDVELYSGDHYTRLVHKSKLVFLDDDGHEVKIKYYGPGHADVLTTNGQTYREMGGDVMRIVFGETTEESKLKIRASDGTTVGDIIIKDDIKYLDARDVTVVGNIEIGGTVDKKIHLAAITGGQVLTIGPPQDPDTKGVKLYLGEVEDLTILSETPIRYIQTDQWIDTDGTPDRIEAAWLEKLYAKGDFQADLVLSGAGADDYTLKYAKVHDDLEGVTWDVDGQMGKLKVYGSARDVTILADAGIKYANIYGDLVDSFFDITGELDKLKVMGTAANVTVRTTGRMGKIRLGAADGADFLAGIAEGAARHAESAADFVNLNAEIESFKIQGLKDDGARWYFSNSNLSAPTIEKVDLRNIRFDNNVVDFGIYARDAGTGEEIGRVRYNDEVTGAKWTWPWEPQQYFNTQDFEILLL